MNFSVRYHVVDHWHTAASDYPRGSEGQWSIATRRQDPGIHQMQEWGAFYFHRQPIDLTVLKEGNKTWFTDEPRQIHALSEVGLFRARGHVVVGGLGLGLIHHFLKLNPQVIRVTTIERAPELRKLTWPHVQVGTLITGNFYECLPEMAAAGEHVDTIITDFIFGHQNEATWGQLQTQQVFCQQYFPDAQFLEHGWQRRMDAETVGRVLPTLLFEKVFEENAGIHGIIPAQAVGRGQ